MHHSQAQGAAPQRGPSQTKPGGYCARAQVAPCGPSASAAAPVTVTTTSTGSAGASCSDPPILPHQPEPPARLVERERLANHEGVLGGSAAQHMAEKKPPVLPFCSAPPGDDGTCRSGVVYKSWIFVLSNSNRGTIEFDEICEHTSPDTAFGGILLLRFWLPPPPPPPPNEGESFWSCDQRG